MPCTSGTSSSFASARTSNNLSVSSPPTSEAPNSSPILKNGSSTLRKTSPVTPSKPRATKSNYPILRGSSPILKSSSSDLESSPIQRVSSPVPRSSSPIPRSSSYTASASPPTVPGESDPTTSSKHGPFKRAYQYSLLEDEDKLEDNGHSPTKRSKMLFTLFTTKRPPDTAVYFTEHMLELSRVSRQTFAAKIEYQRLHAEELELITAIIRDELEESKGHVTKADLQIGSLQNDLYDAGVPVIGSKGRPSNHAPKEVEISRLFPNHGGRETDDSSDIVSKSFESNSGI
ncbi:hypothetical protein F4604DRAFT_1920662 [Suillus subluteus]|nr:hypothetical protein F4604DRAFT_1920662 [Suillus subluteus]